MNLTKLLQLALKARKSSWLRGILATPEIAAPRASHGREVCPCGCPAGDEGRDRKPYCWACLAAQKMDDFTAISRG